MLRRIRSLFKLLIAREDFESGMSEEIRFHIERHTADLVRSGVPPEAAARRARLELGPVASVQEECREARGVHLADGLTRHLRYASRLLKKSTTFTTTALLTLAICLGTNLTIFSVIDSVLLQPLPFPDPGRLVTVFNTYPKAGVDRDGSSLTNYYERRGQIAALESMALYRPTTAVAGEPGATEREEIMRITPEFFAVLGSGPVIGRAFTEEESTYQADDVAIVTDQYWKERLGTDPAVTGRRIRVDGVTKRVVGVLAPDFRFLSAKPRLYLPLSSSLSQRAPSERHSGGNSTHLIARLKGGISIAAAQAQIDGHNSALAASDPEGKAMAQAGFRSIVDSLHADHVAAVRPTLILLQTGALVLLLTGLVNLVNLLLIRANGRVKELAVRRALGAGQANVLAEVLVETGVLVLFGVILGLSAGAAGTHLVSVFVAGRLPLGFQVAMNGRIVFVVMAAMVVVGIALAAPVAWFHLSGQIGPGLQAGSRGGTASHAVQRLRQGFVVAQIAAAVVLLVAAGLLAQSLKNAMAVAPGFRPENILSGQISMPWSSYRTAHLRLAFADRVMTEIARQPGVRAAGFVTNLPFSGNSGKSAATAKGFVRKPGESPGAIYSYGAGGDYFNALGISLLAGRFLTAEDSKRDARVCVVDEDFARRQWPASSALGRQLWQGFRRPEQAVKEFELFTVVGVAGRVKQAGLTEDSSQGAVYYPYVFRADSGIFVAVRTVLTADSFAVALQKVVRALDPELPVNDVRSMETRIATTLVTRRSPALLAGLFAAIAVLLTALGTYGVLSFSVAQRRREIGVRMALGARPERIRREFLAIALRLLVPGTIIGLMGSALSAQAMRSILFQIPALNAQIFAGAAGVIVVVALAASLLPANRAARISPLEALSGE